MDQLIDTIRAAVATDASKEQKAAGVQACRTIAAALDTEPGRPIMLPGTPAKPPLSGVSLDQVLDLAIAKLTSIASAQEAQAAPALPASASAVPSRAGLRVPAPVAIAVPPNMTRPANVVPRSAKVARPENLARAPNRARAPNLPRPTSARPTSPKNA